MMNYLKYVFTILLLGFLTLYSCSKEEAETGASTTKGNELKTKIDGQDWSGPILSWAVSGGTRQINATFANSSIQIFMPVDTTGTFDASGNDVTVSYSDGITTWSNNVTGFVHITANSDDLIEGDFEMVIGSYFNSDTLSLTEGTFYFKSL